MLACLFIVFGQGCTKQAADSGPKEEQDSAIINEQMPTGLIEEDVVVTEEDGKEEETSSAIDRENARKVSEEKIKNAEELFSQLKKWQEEKDWEKFFQNKDSYKEKILEYLKDIEYPPHLKLKAKYLVFELSSFLNETSTRQMLKSFTEEIQSLNQADEETLLFLRYVISDLNLRQEAQLKRKVSTQYIKLLKSSSSPDLLKREAEVFHLSRDIDNFAAISSAYFDLIEDKDVLKREILLYIEKASCDGFKDACEPYFTEGLFSRLTDEFNDELDEDTQYLRGYNLESAFEFQNAADIYNSFLERFPQSKLAEEVIFRLGYIYMYKLRDFSKSGEYFLKLKERGYGVSKQLMILNKEFDKERVSYNEKVFLEALLRETQLPRNTALQIESKPSRVFTDDTLSVRSISFSPDTGCIVPEGLFLWSGDLGGVKITTNTPDFSTSFNEEGLKIIQLVEQIPKGVLGFDSSLINVYSINVESEGSMFKDTDVIFKATIKPSLPEKFLSYSWKVTREEDLVCQSDKDEFSYRFFNPGDYIAVFSLSFSGNQIYTYTFSFTIL